MNRNIENIIILKSDKSRVINYNIYDDILEIKNINNGTNDPTTISGILNGTRTPPTEFWSVIVLKGFYIYETNRYSYDHHANSFAKKVLYDFYKTIGSVDKYDFSEVKKNEE